MSRPSRGVEIVWILPIFSIYGPDYWNVLGRKVQKSKIDNMIQQQILLEDGVLEIISFISTKDNSTRQYSATFNCRLVSGETTGDVTITLA